MNVPLSSSHIQNGNALTIEKLISKMTSHRPFYPEFRSPYEQVKQGLERKEVKSTP
jgi:hypothetical protein